MRRLRAVLAAIIIGATLPRSTLAGPQSETYVPQPAVPRLSAPTSEQVPANQVLELAPLHGPRLPLAPPPIAEPIIPSPFLGCWEAKPDKFDMIVDSFGSATIGSPGEIIFCYRENRIEVPEAKIHFGIGDWIKDVLLHLGLGLTLAKLDPAGITTQIYAVTNTQIHARSCR